MSAQSRKPKEQGPADAEQLRRLPLLRNLMIQELQALWPLLSRQHVRARDTFTLDRDFKGKCVFAWSGRHRLISVAPNRKSVTLAIIAPGDAFGHALALLDYSPGDVMRLHSDEPGLLLIVSNEDLFNLARRSSALNHAIMRSLAELLIENSARLFEMAALDVRSRVQAELIRMTRHGQTIGKRIIIKPAPTHAVLGAQVGASREVVTRHLRDLANENVISFDRGVIEILNPAKLWAMDEISTGRKRYQPPLA